MSMEWHGAAKNYLARLGADEYAAHIRSLKGKSAKRNRYAPSEYMRELIDCLNRNDEEGFKARKMLAGYASAAGV